jgi:hypothetical protein
MGKPVAVEVALRCLGNRSAPDLTGAAEWRGGPRRGTGCCQISLPGKRFVMKRSKVGVKR